MPQDDLDRIKVAPSMVREILCRNCRPALVQKLCREDIIAGWQERAVYVALRVYAICDHCALPLENQIVVAVTRWQGNSKDNPRYWEEEFGTVLDSHTVRTAEKLSETPS